MAPNRQNLSYEAKEPPFLAKLRAQQAGGNVDSDRHERAVPRPTGKKEYLARRGGDDDDGPTIVEEDGNTLSKEEFDAMVAGAEESEDKDELTNVKGGAVPGREESVEGKTAEQHSAKGSTATVGAKPFGPKKRKAVPVGDDGSEEDGSDEGRLMKAKPLEKKKKKLTKKRKGIKVSFNEDG